MILNLNNKKNKCSFLFFSSIFFFVFLLHNYNQNNTVRHIFIIIHGVWTYSLQSILFEFYRKKLIAERWHTVKNKKAEQKGLIDITDINDPEEYLERERSIIQYKKNNNKQYPFSGINNLEENLKLRKEAYNKNNNEKYAFSSIKYFKYNWDGFLSEESRNNAGKILAKEILLLKQKYPISKIHIIGYSHGGNVALNIINHLPKNSNLEIDELILMATPIGKKTEKLAKKKNRDGKYFFQEISCLYSTNDFTQIKDFLFNFPTCHRFLEERLENVHIIQCQYKYYYADKKIKYIPDHKDFMIESKKKLLEKKYFTYLPIIFYLPEIIYSRTEIRPDSKIIRNSHLTYTLPLKELNYNDNK